MSLAFSQDEGAFEWSGTSIRGLFSQPYNLIRPRFWRMLLDVIRFNYFALDLLRNTNKFEFKTSCSQSDVGLIPGMCNRAKEESIGEYLDRNGYSAEFKNDYLIPINAATWCTDPNFFASHCPARLLVRSMYEMFRSDSP